MSLYPTSDMYTVYGIPKSKVGNVYICSYSFFLFSFLVLFEISGF